MPQKSFKKCPLKPIKGQSHRLKTYQITPDDKALAYRLNDLIPLLFFVYIYFTKNAPWAISCFKKGAKIIDFMKYLFF